MSSRTSRAAAVLALAVALVATGAVWRLVSGAGEASDTTRSVVAAPHAGIWRRLQSGPSATVARRAERRRFRLMRGPVEAMPMSLQTRVKAVLGAPSSARFARTQLAQTHAGGVWVVELEKATCLVQAGSGAAACDSTAGFVRRGIVLGLFEPPTPAGGPPRGFLVLGIAPDWARTVALGVGNRVRRVRVHGNVYELRASKPITFQRLKP
jgi:hypothetical protein